MHSDLDRQRCVATWSVVLLLLSALAFGMSAFHGSLDIGLRQVGLGTALEGTE